MSLVILPVNFGRLQLEKMTENNSGQLIPVKKLTIQARK